jgi:hypothetical protein
MRPWLSVFTRRTRSVPNPSIRSEVKMVRCASSFTITSISGAPNRPSRSTSQPALRRTWCRAAISEVKFAIWQPVTKPTLHVAGNPSTSFSQPPAISSDTAAIGDMIYICAFWSHAETSQSAAVVTGRLPPITNPK